MASKVGFVGLDEYSVDMAASLIRSGYKVQAFEVSDSLVDNFLLLGGIRCASPMEAGKGVSALVVVLSHVDQIDDIFCGHEGVFKGLQEGTIIIIRSTILPLHIQKLEKTLTVSCWRTYGHHTPNLLKMAKMILSLTTSSSGCERSWSTFEDSYEEKE